MVTFVFRLCAWKKELLIVDVLPLQVGDFAFSLPCIYQQLNNLGEAVIYRMAVLQWALGSGANDRRPVALVLRTHFWTPYRSLIPMLLEQGIEDRIIRLADRWLRHRQKVNFLTLDHVLEFKTDARELGRLAEFMTAIDPGSPDTRLLQETQRKRRTKAKGKTKSPVYGKLPEPFRTQAATIAAQRGPFG